MKTESGVRARSDNPRSRGPAPNSSRVQLRSTIDTVTAPDGPPPSISSLPGGPQAHAHSSDLPGSRSPLRDAPIRCGATRTTRPPAAISACSRRRDTCRQSSIAHTRSSSRPRAHFTAARCPASSASISRLPRTRPALIHRRERVLVLVRVRPDHDHSDRPWLDMADEADLRRTALTWGGCHAPIKSRRRSSGGGGRHNLCESDQPVDKQSQSQPAVGPRTNRTSRTSPPDDRRL